MPDLIDKVPLTVIIPTKNEAKNIRDCLQSVAWADQVFVVDSNSKDGTESIALELGAEVVQFDYDGGWPKKKNWAIRHLPIRHEWFFILDADERVDGALKQEIEQAITREDVDGFYVRWKFIFLGRWMKHCWRRWMLRLVRKGRGEYEDLGMRGEGGWDNEVHENIGVQGRTAKLKSWLVHDSNEALEFWFKKQNEFSTWNAARRIQQLSEEIPPVTSVFSGDPIDRRKWMKAVYLRMPFKPFIMFVYLYLFQLGFLDGRAGYYFCALRAGHEMNIEAKRFEREF